MCPPPCALLIHSWLWLAAEADDFEEKRRCLNAVLLGLTEKEHTLSWRRSHARSVREGCAHGGVRLESRGEYFLHILSN